MPAVSPIVHARSAQVGVGERESRRYWGQQLVVRGQLHSPMGKLVMRAAHVAPIRARCFNSKRTSFHVALELEHMESVDLRSEIRKADAVLPVFARAGQRSDTLKRVARRGRCRLLFLLGVQHIRDGLVTRFELLAGVSRLVRPSFWNDAYIDLLWKWPWVSNNQIIRLSPKSVWTLHRTPRLRASTTVLCGVYDQ